MSKKQLCIEFLRVLSAFCIHYMVILSPLMLIAAFLFVDNVIHSHPTLLKTILTFFFVDIAEMALAWHYAGKCEKDPEHIEKYARKYLEKTATYYFETDKLRKERREWHKKQWTTIMSK